MVVLWGGCSCVGRWSGGGCCLGSGGGCSCGVVVVVVFVEL